MKSKRRDAGRIPRHCKESLLFVRLPNVAAVLDILVLGMFSRVSIATRRSCSCRCRCRWTENWDIHLIFVNGVRAFEGDGQDSILQSGGHVLTLYGSKSRKERRARRVRLKSRLEGSRRKMRGTRVQRNSRGRGRRS